jgi:hypothetical protein
VAVILHSERIPTTVDGFEVREGPFDIEIELVNTVATHANPVMRIRALQWNNFWYVDVYRKIGCVYAGQL